MEEENYLFSAPTLILLAIGVIALLGLIFLAIEGGRIYMERFQAQNAANDVAAVMCYSGYDFTMLDGEFSVPEGFSKDRANTITAYHPPAAGEYAGNTDYVEIVVSRPVSGVLASLVSSHQVDVTGRRVVSCKGDILVLSSAARLQD